MKLLAVAVDATIREVPATYEGIKDGLDDATFDFVKAISWLGCYVDDEGMLTDKPLNIAASMIMARPLYGPVVFCKGDPDFEGNTLPLDSKLEGFVEDVCARWRSVIDGAQHIGQVIEVLPNAETIPPPQIIGLDDEQFMEFLINGTLPTTNQGEEDES